MTSVREADAPIPLTELTGFPGVGKTALLDWLLGENRVADSFIHEECRSDEARVSRLAFIGRDITRPAPRRGLEAYAAG